MGCNPLYLLKNILKKEIIPTELICYPIVTSVTLLEIIPEFRTVDYYYHFDWPFYLMVSTPISLGMLILAYNFLGKSIVKFLLAILPLISILTILCLKAAEELNYYSSDPNIFFQSYLKVIIFLFVAWIAVTYINECLKEKIEEYKKKEVTKG